MEDVKGVGDAAAPGVGGNELGPDEVVGGGASGDDARVSSEEGR